LGERTLWVDCDVLEADGGTRTAAITGGSICYWLGSSRFLLSSAILKFRQEANSSDSACRDQKDLCYHAFVRRIWCVHDLSASVSISGPGANKLTIQRNPLATLFRIFNLTTTGSVSISGSTLRTARQGPIIAGVPFRTQVAEHLRFLNAHCVITQPAAEVPLLTRAAVRLRSTMAR
jgi:hypothetical protein